MDCDYDEYHNILTVRKYLIYEVIWWRLDMYCEKATKIWKSFS